MKADVEKKKVAVWSFFFPGIRICEHERWRIKHTFKCACPDTLPWRIFFSVKRDNEYGRKLLRASHFLFFFKAKSWLRHITHYKLFEYCCLLDLLLFVRVHASVPADSALSALSGEQKVSNWKFKKKKDPVLLKVSWSCVLSTHVENKNSGVLQEIVDIPITT